MKNLKNLFKKNYLLTLVVCLLMIFSFSMFNIGYNSVESLSNNKNSIPGENKTNQKYVDVSKLNGSLDNIFYPSFLLDDERISYYSDDNGNNSSENFDLPTISIGLDKDSNAGFFKTVTTNDLVMDSDDPLNKIKSINFQLNRDSSHYKNSYLGKMIFSSNTKTAEKLSKFYQSLLYNVFLSSESLFQKNLIHTINQVYSDSLSGDEKVFSDISDCALKLINPNNSDGLNRNWIESNKSSHIITINRYFNDVSNEPSSYEYDQFWKKMTSNITNGLAYGYNGQIGSFQNFDDHIYTSKLVDGDSVQKINGTFFSGSAQYWSNWNGKSTSTDNFYCLSFSMINSNDYRYNNSKDDNYFKNANNYSETYGDIYYKISKNVSLQNSFMNYYYDYIGSKLGITVQKRTELLSYDLSNGYNFKLVNGNDVDYNNEFKIINKSNSLNMDNWDYDQVLISPGFFKSNDLEIGDELVIDNINVTISGVATDTYNVYPTVYNNEYISDSTKDCVVYCSQSLIKKLFEKDADLANSMNDYLFFGANKDTSNKSNDLKKQINNFFSYLNYGKDNSKTNSILSSKIGNFSNLHTFYYGYKMINYVSSLLAVIMLFFSILFFILSISIYLIIIKEIINSQRKIIGILKANGYSFFEVTKEYYYYLLLTIIPSLLIGFFISLGMLNLFVEKLSHFFSLVVSTNVSYLFFCLIFVVYIAIALFSFTLLLNKKINVSPITLMNTETQAKVKPLKVKKRIRLRGSLIASFYKTSKIQMLLLMTVSFLSSSITIISSIMVVFFYNYNSNKFNFYSFNSQTSYNNLVSGNPLNQIISMKWNNNENTLEDEDDIKNGLLPYQFKTKTADEVHSISDLKNYKSDIVNYLWELILEGISFNYQKNLSISYLSWIANNIVGGSNSEQGTISYINYRNICEDISNLLATYLPKAFGMDEISYEEYPTTYSRGTSTLSDAYVDVWKTILNKIVDEKMNSDSKVVWKQKNTNVANFNLGFNTVPIDQYTEKMTVVDMAVDLKNDSGTKLFGQKVNASNGFKIKNMKNLQTLNNKKTNENELNVYATELYKSKHKENSCYININYNQLQFLSNSATWIDFSDYKNEGEASWYYEDENGNLNNLYNNDRTFSAIPISDNDNIVYLDKNEKAVLNINDIVLKIKKNDISNWNSYNITDFQKLDSGMKNLLDEDNAPKIKTTFGEDAKLVSDDGNYYYIRPYSYDFSSNPNTGFDANLKTTWYDAAVNISKNKTVSLIQSNSRSKKIKVNIVGNVEDYSSENFYTDQTTLNRLMGLSNDDSWFNSSTSQASLPPNVIWSYAFTNINGDNSLKYFSNTKTLNDSSEYIGTQKEIIKKITSIVISFGLIIYVMILILVVTSTVFISRNFIFEFKNTILVLKAIGYSRSKIRSIIITLLLTPMLLGSLLSNFFLLSFLNFVAKSIVSSKGIIVPIGNGISLLPITFIVTAVIAVVTFIIINKIIEKTKLTEIN